MNFHGAKIFHIKYILENISYKIYIQICTKIYIHTNICTNMSYKIIILNYIEYVRTIICFFFISL